MQTYVDGYNAGSRDALNGTRLTEAQLASYSPNYRSGYARAHRDAYVINAAEVAR